MLKAANFGKFKFLFLFITLFVLNGCEISYNPSEDKFEEYVSLEGEWKFSIGDDLSWAGLNYDDEDWIEIKVPSSWEDEGFHGYNGYAWYRKDFLVPDDYDNRSLDLHLGYIDDVDEVYINGKLAGHSGTFPPEYNTAYNAYRKYTIPGNILITKRKNLIAVRVFDSQLSGGLVSGDFGFYINEDEIKPAVDLIGEWKFKTGDTLEWKEKSYDDSNWSTLFVPSYWENQGFRDYDGFAWYRKEFTLPANLLNKKLIILVGKIDDLDEVYLNGNLIGATGVIEEDSTQIQFDQEYQALRGYFIPDTLISSKENTIAVRVYDGFRDGGIYEGPVGIITQETYTEYWRNKKESRGFFD